MTTTPRKPAPLAVAVTSDGTPAGTRVHVNGRPLRHVVALDLHADADGVSCTVTIGAGQAIDYGPAAVDAHDVPATIRPAPTPRDPR